MHRPYRLLLLAGVVTVMVSSTSARGGDDGTPSASKADDRAQREKAFSEKLSGATLVGSFTVQGKNDGKPPKPERYELGAVKKVKDNYWLFVHKIKYADKDYKVPVPLTLPVYWADDTPVISLTNLKIPGMKGSFTARVLFYGDRYVGTWQHDDVGGHMFGTIEPAKKKTGDEKNNSGEKK